MTRNGDLVILVHGLAANRLVMKPLELRLRRRGFMTLNWGYRSIRGSIEQHATDLAQMIAETNRRNTVAKIQLVTHSMGCIVARTALLEACPEKAQRLVMLAPPNQGSRVAAVFGRGLGWLCRPLCELADSADSFVNRLPQPDGIEVGIVAAQHDRVVALSSTRLETAVDHCIVPAGHTSMLFRHDVANSVVEFLEIGRFSNTTG